VIAADGTLDRPALARIVFDTPAERAVLTASCTARAPLAQHAKPRSPDGTIVVQSFRCCSKASTRALRRYLAVVAPDASRIERVMRRDSIDRESVLQRMRAQIDRRKPAGAHTYVIENDADLATSTTAQAPFTTP